MALCEIRLNSQNALRKSVTFLAVVPDDKPGPFAVLYLLHGLSDDHSGWLRRTGVERYVEKVPLIVVMPNADRSYYTDSPVSPSIRYETFICRDLIGFVDRTFPTIASAKGRAVAGLSMGGYGALKLALKHPDLFCAAAGYSGALDMAKEIADSAPNNQELKLIFGESPAGGPDDLFATAERADRSTLPSLYFDCGVDDVLVDSNRRFHTHLTELCIPHEYHELDGGHTWHYWQRSLRQTLPWLCGELGIKIDQPLPVE